MHKLWFFLSALSFLGTAYPLLVSLRKLTYSAVNVADSFVGGDAYNFIINSTQSGTYMLISATNMICAVLFLIAGYLHLILAAQKRANDKN